MNVLLTQVLQAHGGIDRWNKFSRVTATIIGGGGLWALKGLEATRTPREMTATIHEQTASAYPFGRPEWHSVFERGRVAIETSENVVVSERLNPRMSFLGHAIDTPWDPLHLAYFNGYAMWTYLNTPFLLGLDRFEVSEIDPWQEENEVWRVLRTRFSTEIESHCIEQDFYFGEDFLLRRHDYQVDVAGRFRAAQYVSDFVQVNGISFPTKRRAYMRGNDLKPIRDLLLVSIDLSNFRLE
ncbi:hypothetical protein [Pseudomonas sp. Irchel 3A7]|uniref:hypothetical protein n=1 Tax=Pseudomonas sp. Irchel 3A7 TaxID=2008913 RepID=UPI000BA422DA|nr:hypothetical protein [Pseudomonas sp. Irchel 3A7]